MAYPYFEFIGSLRSGGSILSDIKVVRQKDKLVIIGKAGTEVTNNDVLIRWSRKDCESTTIAEVALRVGAMGKPAAVRIQYSLNLSKVDKVKNKNSGPLIHFLNLAKKFKVDNIEENVDSPKSLPEKIQQSEVENQSRSTVTSPVTIPGKKNKKPQQFKIVKKVDLIDAGVNTDLATEKFLEIPKDSMCTNCNSTMTANDIISSMKFSSTSRNNFRIQSVPTLKRPNPSKKPLKVVKRVKQSLSSTMIPQSPVKLMENSSNTGTTSLLNQKNIVFNSSNFTTIFQSPGAGSKEIINLASILASPSKMGLDYISPVKFNDTSNSNSVDNIIRELAGPKRALFDQNDKK